MNRLSKIGAHLSGAIAALIITASAATACAHMERDNSTSQGTYWILVNGCSYGVHFVYSAGYDGSGRVRELSAFVAAQRRHRIFIFNPQPARYNYTR